MSVHDDVNVVFEALSEWCRSTGTRPNSVQGCSIACRLFDLFQGGCDTREALLSALRGEAAAGLYDAAAGGQTPQPTAIAS
jgi:hypothetical protein